jgi:uncharacterized protein YlxW (UPF0749 family)
MSFKMGVHLDKFNNRVKVLNQTQSKNMTLTADEVRNLQTDIFDLLSAVASMEVELQQLRNAVAASGATWDGGSF